MLNHSMSMPPMSARQEESLRRLVLVIYLIYLLSLFTGVPVILAVLLSYARLDESRGTLYHGHLRWMLRSFWWGLFWLVLGSALVLAGLASAATYASNDYLQHDLRLFGGWMGGIGMAVLGLNWLWVVYRMLRGLLNWNDYRRMPL